jgi:hypothetical protein
VPDAHEIAVVDLVTAQQKAIWPTNDAHGNFPMAIYEASSQVVVVFRDPAKLRAYSMEAG